MVEREGGVDMNQAALFRSAAQSISVLEARHWYQLAQLDGNTRVIEQVCAWYTSLIESVVPEYTGMSSCNMAAFLRLPTEYVVLMFDGNLLVATAQASLVRPGGRFEVIVSNVVVESSRRGRGYGTHVVRKLERMVTERWSLPKSFQLRADLTETHTAKFFARLGYVTVGDAVAYKVTS